LLLGSAALASIRALTNARVLRLDASSFSSLLSSSESLAASILRTMTERVLYLQRLSAETPQQTILMIGHPADLACYDLRPFLSGHRFDFRWLDPDDTCSAPLIPFSVSEGPYPAVVLADGAVLREPTNRGLADRLGLQTAPERSVYGVVIIGGGPAGLAAAVYGASEGLKTLLVERGVPAGRRGPVPGSRTTWGFPLGFPGESWRHALCSRRVASARKSSSPARCMMSL